MPAPLELAASWAWRLLLLGAALYVLLWLLRRLTLVIVPLFVAMLAAVVLGPMVDRLSRHVPRALAAWIVVLPMVSILVAGTVLLAQPVVDQLSDLESQLGGAGDDLTAWLEEGPLALEPDRIDDWGSSLRDAGASIVSGFWSEPSDVAGQVSTFLAGVVLTLALVYFLAKDGRSIGAWIIGHLYPDRRSLAEEMGTASADSMRGWLKGVAIAGLIDGVLVGLALVVLDVPAALPLAVLTLLGAFFPLVGATVAGALAALVALAANGVWSAVAVVAVVIVVQQIEGNVLLPVVMRRQVHLHPAVVLVALTLGGLAAGLVGAFLAVPTAAALTAAASVIRQRRQVGSL